MSHAKNKGLNNRKEISSNTATLWAMLKRCDVSTEIQAFEGFSKEFKHMEPNAAKTTRTSSFSL